MQIYFSLVKRKGQSWYIDTQQIQIKIKDRDAGVGFDKDGQFVQQHMRGPDVTLFRGRYYKWSVLLLSFLFLFSKGTQVQ